MLDNAIVTLSLFVETLLPPHNIYFTALVTNQ